MVEFDKLAMADVLRHPQFGLVSFQGDVRDKIGDRIMVRDINFCLHEVKTSECERPSRDGDVAYYWRNVEKVVKEERKMEKEIIDLVEERDGVGFPSAMAMVMNGGKVARRGWEDKRIRVGMVSNILSIIKPDGVHPWIISEGDMEAEDWEKWGEGDERSRES